MSIVDLNLHPTERQLRQFGFIALAGLPLVAWVLSGMPGPDGWQSAHNTLIGGLAAVGLILAVVGVFRPRLLKPAFLVASLIALPIGFVLGELILLVIFWTTFTPVALVFRLFGRDALQRKVDRSRDSYWQDKAQPQDVGRYYRQS